MKWMMRKCGNGELSMTWALGMNVQCVVLASFKRGDPREVEDRLGVTFWYVTVNRLLECAGIRLKKPGLREGVMAGETGEEQS